MTDEFKPSTWQQPVQDIVKEYDQFEKDQYSEEIQTAPEEVSKSMVRRGMLDPMTGMLTGNSKQSKILGMNVAGFSSRGKENYERIFGHA